MRTSSFLSLVSVWAVAVGCGGASERPPSSGSGGTGNDATGGGGMAAGNSSAGGRTPDITLPGGDVLNPCEQPDAPKDCELVAPGPACGDGKKNQDSEECDDHNGLPGDGCSGVCKVEAHWVCPGEGQPCTSTIVCGDGVLGPGEACEDGNTADGDGCAANCKRVEAGYLCRTPNEPCTRVFVCGDETLDPNEGCDDGNVTAGDGCSDRCRIEFGFKCEGTPSACTETTCGDGKVEGAESCDDGNTLPFDGCSATCQADPTCPTMGACKSGCGDGIVLDEDCDDGNLRDGDGCSSACEVEESFGCTNAACDPANADCTIIVPVMFRDFNAHGSAGGHPDFQADAPGSLTKGLVETTWDEDKKPVLKSTVQTGTAFLHGREAFAQWYRNEAPASPIPGSIVLYENEKGGYVNRWGANGEQWKGYVPNVMLGGMNYPQQCSATDCTECGEPPAGTVCLDDCVAWGTDNRAACFTPETLYDGNPLFFPLDGIASPPALADMRHPAKVPEQYGFNGWPWEVDVAAALGQPAPAAHNFAFTTEVKYWFKYEADATAVLDFTGDDDVWVFVNGTLAVDLGGYHVPESGSVTINEASAARFGLEDGNVYQIGVFHAERKMEGSSFRLTLSGFNLAPSDCRTNCGDGIVGVGEECDDGSRNLGGYNQCSPGCTYGPRCGDAVVQEGDGEICDNGVTGNDGAYGSCAPTCQLGPHCGDAVVQPEGNEQCDDGVNDGGYGECSAGCIRGPFCGDGRITLPMEDCDDANNTDKDGCSAQCKFEVVTR